MVQERGGPGLAAEPDQRHGARGSILGEDLQGHAAAQALLHRLVDDAHAAPADLAEDAVIAQALGDRPLEPRPVPDRGRPRLVVAAEPLHHRHRWEELADLVGQVRASVGVFGQRRPLAPPVSLGEFVRQMIERVRSGPGLAHGQGSSQSPPRSFKISLSRRSART